MIFLQWLPWLLRMSRPGKTLTRKGILMETKLKELEKGDKQGNSLLAVLDMEDEIIPGTGPRNKSNQPTTKQPSRYSSLLDPDRWNFPNKVNYKTIEEHFTKRFNNSEHDWRYE